MDLREELHGVQRVLKIRAFREYAFAYRAFPFCPPTDAAIHVVSRIAVRTRNRCHTRSIDKPGGQSDTRLTIVCCRDITQIENYR